MPAMITAGSAVATTSVFVPKRRRIATDPR
jgi:hypothetical protein